MASCILHREWEHKLADTEYKFAGEKYMNSSTGKIKSILA
jgi:hypothetical protein